MLSVVIKVQAPPSRLDELSRSCRLEIVKIRREAGCLGSVLSRDAVDGAILTVEETWENRACLDAHFRSDHFSALIGAMKQRGGRLRVYLKNPGKIGD
ncbi:MAG: antibiotic biosynthesis monooxygenase [Desulfobacterales bacterium]|nr:antibiotic biosynthesis monooxygenase [Desulfobacterales bacterium]